MLNKSESIANLVKALSTLQGELKDADKNALNPHFKSKYADLSEVLGNLRPLLAKNQLALSQFPSFENGIVSVTSLLAHASGEWIESTASAPATKQDVQGVGSAITYLKRYSAAAIVGMASADQDDDGNSVSIQKVENKPIVKQEVKDFRPQTVDAAKIETIIQGYAKALVIAGVSEAQVNEKIDTARSVSKQKPFDAFSKEYGDKIVKLKSMVKTEDIPF
jgi:hypothetical protein